MKFEIGANLFDIPDAWLKEADCEDFKAARVAYRCEEGSDTSLVSIRGIEPPKRNNGIRWSEKNRTISILRGIVSDMPMPPIEVHIPPELEEYQYAVKNGFHRFYCSAALGYEQIPVLERKFFDPHAL